MTQPVVQPGVFQGEHTTANPSNPTQLFSDYSEMDSRLNWLTQRLSEAIRADLVVGCCHLATDRFRCCTQAGRLVLPWPMQDALHSFMSNAAGPLARLAVSSELPLVTRLNPREPAHHALIQPIDQLCSTVDVIWYSLWGSMPDQAGFLLARFVDQPKFNDADLDRLQQSCSSLERILADAKGRHPQEVEPTGVEPSSLNLKSLSQTEERVALLLEQGLTERQVAEALNRSRHTVHVHVKNIYRKLGVRSRSECIDAVRAARPASP